ncbi:MAG: hypothetical protein A3F40_00330 [Chlamydiae bacterium RIFCSPHIGHO2_12_FULL_27_8]|nr:MAG: hypothetical protein A3F40_00330 [Chlamydiae bacterium RIFCSPHIGHO2_12_FULL_27_8]
MSCQEIKTKSTLPPYELNPYPKKKIDSLAPPVYNIVTDSEEAKRYSDLFKKALKMSLITFLFSALLFGANAPIVYGSQPLALVLIKTHIVTTLLITILIFSVLLPSNRKRKIKPLNLGDEPPAYAKTIEATRDEPPAYAKTIEATQKSFCH